MGDPLFGHEVGRPPPMVKCRWCKERCEGFEELKTHVRTKHPARYREIQNALKQKYGTRKAKRGDE